MKFDDHLVGKLLSGYPLRRILRPFTTRKGQVIEGQMPVRTKHLDSSGKTVIEAVVACVVLALLACLVVPALSKDRDDAHIAKCADHQKQLAQAAHQYAGDHEGKFFYNRSLRVNDQKQVVPGLAARWYDPEIIGPYIEGELMLARFYYTNADNLRTLPTNQPPPPDWPHHGLGGGVFVCPSDDKDAGRSYNMNYWAGNGYPDRKNRATMWPLGELFDSNSPELDRLLLFTDAMGFVKTSKGWVGVEQLGKLSTPGGRFGGGMGGYVDDGFRYHQWKMLAYFSLLDYVRHSNNEDRRVPIGAVNIAYADGHVALKEHSKLYDPNTGLSTYETLWSLIDPQVDKARQPEVVE